jgi:pimeloyl-ACP methyl ester carboxylesterase
VEALRVKIGADKIIVWGNSYGASLATIYAARFPDRVSGIILTSPGSYPGTQSKRDYKTTNRGKINLSPAISAAAGKIDSQGAAAEASLSQADAGTLFDEIANADLMGAMVCKGAQLKFPALGIGGNLFANRLIAKDLDRIKFKPLAALNVPALIIRGSCDFLPESNAARYASLLKTSVTTIPQSGHGLMENPAAMDAAFAAFAVGPLAQVK